MHTEISQHMYASIEHTILVGIDCLYEYVRVNMHIKHVIIEYRLKKD